MSISNPYHEGELAVQRRANETEIAQINGTAIDETIMAGALRFISQQPMAIVGSMDSRGQVWASTLTGTPGFIRAVDVSTLVVDLSKPTTAEDDPLWTNLVVNPNVGMLIIELGSRRRLRINGLARIISNQVIIDVERAYPNCPRYIQRRGWKIADDGTVKDTIPRSFGKELNQTQQTVIANADTLFVASAHTKHGVDASHRGGHPGFIKIINNRLLRIPDFSGNSMFNTLGNFDCYPHAGLVLIDFENGRSLQLTGHPKILWDLDDPQGETGGSQRFWEFEITAWQESTVAHPIVWEYLDASHFIPKLQNNNPTNFTLSLKVDCIRCETEHIRSIRLRCVDDKPLPEFQPGSHLQIKVNLANGNESLRQYSILSDPNQRSFYEIAVLKQSEGRGGSVYMHEQVKQGDVLEVRALKNEFPMTTNAEHSILIAGGIGITPILSMLHQLAAEKQSFEIHYSARQLSGLAMKNRVAQLAGDKAYFYTSQEAGSRRLDLKRLLSTPKHGVHIYVCGPRGMINAVREIGLTQRWSPAQIHFESFGSQPLADDRPIRVHLLKSKKTITVPSDRSILDTLLDEGINVAHDCKRGECSMCTTRIVEGEPDHRDLCLNPEERTSSMCVCVSRAKSKDLTLYV